MSGLRLFDAGFVNLVSVVPPDGVLSPESKIDPKQRGKVPGLLGPSGWHGYGWTEKDPTREEVERWEKWGANIGLRGTFFPALDIDCDSVVLSQAVRAFAEQKFGTAPARTSRGTRRLLVYRTRSPFTRMAAIITYKGTSHLVEMLGHKNQYLVHGRHPSGTKYGWENIALWEYLPDDLTLVTIEDVREFFTALAEKLRAKGIEVELLGTGQIKDKIKVPVQTDLLAPSPDALRECVAAIPNEYPTREEYILFGHAVKAAAGPLNEATGLAIFQEWAARWPGDSKNPDGNDPETVASDWSRMHPPYRVGWPWLADLVIETGGGKYVPATDEFEAIDLPAPSEEAAPLLQKADENLIVATESWAADQIAKILAPNIRYVQQTGHWHVWNGSAWEQDQAGKILLAVHQELLRLSKVLLNRADTAPSKTEGRELRSAAKKLQSRTSLNNVVALMEFRAEVATAAVAFDTDPWVLNTPDGIVNLKTGEIRPSDQGALCTKRTAVAPRDGQAPNWFRFLQEATGGDRELQRFLQKQAGYALTGVTTEQTLSFVWGPTGTGKTTFIETLAGALGDYAVEAPMDAFVSSRFDRHPTDLAGLIGARLVRAEETQAGRKWDEQRVKKITGGGKLRVRFMRQDFFEYTPTFKLVVIGNHEPEIENPDDAMRRRIHIVPFVTKPAAPDNMLREKLRAEWPQILAWAVEGCLLWQREGLLPPAVVTLKTTEYFADENPAQQWIQESCVLEPNAQATRTDLYQSWTQWCHRRGEDPGPFKRFKRKMDGLGLRDMLVGQRRLSGYRGIRLVTLAEEEVDSLLGEDSP